MVTATDTVAAEAKVEAEIKEIERGAQAWLAKSIVTVSAKVPGRDKDNDIGSDSPTAAATPNPLYSLALLIRSASTNNYLRL